jgi:hypothetical protein
MERIEIPAEVYFKSNDGKKFRLQAECERWEAALAKRARPEVFREFENEEGQLCYAFWVEAKDELEDVLWFFDTKYHTRTVWASAAEGWQPQWIIIYPYYDGYNSDYYAETAEEFKTTLYETKQAVEDALSEVIKLIWEKTK